MIKFEVTRAMVEVASDHCAGLVGYSDEQIAAMYRAMRALEPGPHQGAPERQIVPARMEVSRAL